ncbi:HAMP domain-containing histidine kinase [Sulfurimonas lithotrophica]|uniref:histidine kinase n=1 Tax=Sulfurimonas lithotrophica TaxID=2590022 RepID=A0A5P8P3R6_9BACT|nr:HAMP domain-containing sensor histidine kinase [Sulfurimonas lithotrophica]QFR50334.1 HAMP domain-containing histidine kinase [Sulfurimonas lithotrophica]
MNDASQKSFWLFLSLYLSSSFILLITSSYWFYNAQVSMQKANDYYKLKNISDEVSSEVIMAHMMNKPLSLKKYPNTSIGLFNKKKELLYGSVIQDIDFTKDKYMIGDVFSVISHGAANHLNIAYVVVQNTESVVSLKKIREKIFFITTAIAMLIIIIAVVLGKIFLKPIKDKIQEIEDFVKDTTHELNTPITALMMSTSRLKDVKECNKKSIQNISISTKQLYDIYSSLSYINFETKEKDKLVMFDNIVKESAEYFNELIEKKNIVLTLDTKPCSITIAPTKAKMLINNLLSNSIKYSHPNSNIKIYLDETKLIVEDEGIGIEDKKLKTIFKRFTRANSYAGGFGVGMSIIESIIKEYSFKIEINSTVNVGTKITIYFTKSK